MMTKMSLNNIITISSKNSIIFHPCMTLTILVESLSSSYGKVRGAAPPRLVRLPLPSYAEPLLVYERSHHERVYCSSLGEKQNKL